MHMRTMAVLFVGLLLGGCAYFGGDQAREAAGPFDLDELQRAQWQQQAEQGDTEAQYRLGLAFCCGYGPARTQTVARDWLCRAALGGHAGAQFQLGQLFGFRMTNNRPMSLPAYPDYAHLWYSLAAAQGHELALAYQVAIEQDLSPTQLARSRAWQSHPADAGC